MLLQTRRYGVAWVHKLFQMKCKHTIYGKVLKFNDYLKVFQFRLGLVRILGPLAQVVMLQTSLPCLLFLAFSLLPVFARLLRIFLPRFRNF